MKKKLHFFIFVLFVGFAISAQTTHNLDWFAGIGTNDLNISQGDTVIWTWTSPSHTVESTEESTESFDSGFFEAEGTTFSHTFNLEGVNPYFCGIHGASSMSGTITVAALSVTTFDGLTSFSIVPNPGQIEMNISFSQPISNATVEVLDVLGKRIFQKSLHEEHRVSVDTSRWSRGIYMVRISNSELTQTKRFVKH